MTSSDWQDEFSSDVEPSPRDLPSEEEARERLPTPVNEASKEATPSAEKGQLPQPR